MIADYIIGIDPDTERNGYALLDAATGMVTVETVKLPAMLDLVEAIQSTAMATDKRLKVYVEAGWMNQPNWHLGFKDSKAYAAAKGKSLGRNMQRGLDIVEMLKHKGIDVEEVPPLQKIWKGPDKKITHLELVRIVGPVKHTNQEGRDAALLAWVYGNDKTKTARMTRRRGG